MDASLVGRATLRDVRAGLTRLDWGSATTLTIAEKADCFASAIRTLGGEGPSLWTSADVERSRDAMGESTCHRRRGPPITLEEAPLR